MVASTGETGSRSSLKAFLLVASDSFTQGVNLNLYECKLLNLLNTFSF